MNYERAYEIASRFCPIGNFGYRWNTSERTECDLAWAISDYYEDGEEEEAIKAAKLVSLGYAPPMWEPADGNTLIPFIEYPNGQRRS